MMRIGPTMIRVLLVAVIALGTIGLAGDHASGARAPQRERADRPATRAIAREGDPDAWAEAHRRHVERARRADADVVFLGDSITHGWGDEGRDGPGRDAWRAEFDPLRAVPFGFPGDQTQHLLQRVVDGELDGHPRVAVVLIGTNNLGDGQSPEEAASGIVAVVDAIRMSSPSTRVLVVGLLPRVDGSGRRLLPEVASVNAIVQGWASEAEVEFVDAGPGFLRPDGGLDWAKSLDGLHPTTAGYRALAGAIRGPLLGLLQAH